MGRISCRPKVQTTVHSQVLHELEMNQLQKWLEKCFDPQMLLPPKCSPVVAIVLGDGVLNFWKDEMLSFQNMYPLTVITFPRYFFVRNVPVQLHQASRLSQALY